MNSRRRNIVGKGRCYLLSASKSRPKVCAATAAGPRLRFSLENVSSADIVRKDRRSEIALLPGAKNSTSGTISNLWTGHLSQRRHLRLMMWNHGRCVEDKVNKFQKGVIRRIVELLPVVSDENLVRLTHLAEKLDSFHKDAISAVRDAWENKSPAAVLAKQVLSKLSPQCRKKLAVNFFINACLLGPQARQTFLEAHGFVPPFLMVISPTMRCNLRCLGCYAVSYSKRDGLDFDVVDSALRQAKDMGIYFVTISGGEPLFWEPFVDVVRRHDDVYFQVYTNGTLIDERMAANLSRLGNVAPAISVEGFREETDARRGDGVFDRIMRAMEHLRKAGVPFGFSATPTRHNSEVLASDEFIDFYIGKGCRFGWYFQYVPVGRDPDCNNMATPQQRDELRRRLVDFRATRPIFIGDFWNDGPFVGGCIAGARQGRGYFHINSKGDVEPCVFAHFAVDNIRNTSLKDALDSDFFKAIRRRQPCSDNLLKPCMIIDCPRVLREAVKEGRARPTHPGAEAILSPPISAFLDEYADEYGTIADQAWYQSAVVNCATTR